MNNLSPVQLGSGQRVRLEMATPDFFATPLAKLRVENAGTGRVYIIKGERIVAVAKPIGERP